MIAYSIATKDIKRVAISRNHFFKLLFASMNKENQQKKKYGNCKRINYNTVT